MINIKNNQKKITINLASLKKDAQIILDALDYSDFDLGIYLVSPAIIKKYNNKYRNKNLPTDILSFSYYPTLQAGERIEAESDEEKNLGDIIICPEYVQTDLPKWNQDFNHRMKVLLVHGICHLLGYDHERDEDYEVMHKKEEQLLKKIL